MLLYGKPVVQKLLKQTKLRVKEYAPQGAYVWFLLASTDYASSVYVAKKQQYATRCGLWSELFHSPEALLDDVLAKITERNNDTLCVWIVVQLPLWKQLKPFQAQILHAVTPLKDVDWLGGELFGLHLTEVVSFLPATPKATYELLDWYELGDLTGKVVTMIGQSNLMGKPFVVEAMRRRATVFTTNSTTSLSLLKDICKKSDYIIAATGVVWLLSADFFDHADLTWKVIIDVGYWIKDGKACGDSDWQDLVALWATITPVPKGVGPVTVACLFHNLLALHAIRQSSLCSD